MALQGGGGLIAQHCPSAITSWSHELSDDVDEHLFQFHLPSLIFHLCLSSDHQELLSCELRDTNGSIRRRVLDPLRHEVRSIFRSLYHGNSRGRLKDSDIQIAILQALERLAEHHNSCLKEKEVRGPKYESGWAADEISDWNDVVNNPHGLDISTIRDEASDILGMNPAQIMRELSSQWRVIHMECVIREDLLSRFRRYQGSLREALQKDPNGLRPKLPPNSKLEGRVRAKIPSADIIDDMVKPRLTFHGTPIKSVRSIIRHGFLLPGKVIDGKRIESPRSGVAFNRGIYSSQSAMYAMSYASGQREMTPLGALPSMRLFVCATVMGRTYSSRRDPAVHGPLLEGHDSHFDGYFEYIAHDERAMLPCYVFHLDLGSLEAQRAVKAAQRDPMAFHDDFIKKEKTHPKLDNNPAPSPGDVKREQLAKKAAAMKWFPYGFGSASGTNFVIEEIGEVSEDEEEYGEWQADKHAYIPRDEPEDDEEEYYSSWDEEEGKMVTKRKPGLFLDQYQKARHEDVKKTSNRRSFG